jgi:hypothetical protein
MFARQNQGRAAARSLGAVRSRHRAARLWRSLPFAVAALLAGLVTLPQSALAATPPGATFTKLTLLNGWNTYSGSASPAITDRPDRCGGPSSTGPLLGRVGPPVGAT